MILTLLLTAHLAAATLPATLATQQEADAEIAQSITYSELEKEYKEATLQWRADISKAREEGSYPPWDKDPKKDFFARFRAIAKDESAIKADRGLAKLWCLQNIGDSGVNWKDPAAVAGKLAIDLFQNYADQPWLQQIPVSFRMLGWQSPKGAAKALGNMVEFAPTDWLKVSCRIQQATILADRLEDADAALAILDKVAKDFESTRITDDAAKLRRRIANLRIGGVAPEFSGKDVDGNTIKLSDYKGKVIFLDFWGFW